MLKAFDLLGNEMSYPFSSSKKIMKIGKIYNNGIICYHGYFDIDNVPLKIKQEIMKIINTLDPLKIIGFPSLDKEQINYLDEHFKPIEEMLK